LGIIVGCTALVGGFSGPDAWQGVGFIVVTLAAVGGVEVSYRRSNPSKRPPEALIAAESGPTTQTFSDLTTHDGSLRIVRPLKVEPPDAGPYMGVALGTGAGQDFDPVLAAGTALPARAKTSLSTTHGDQQSLEVLLHTSLGDANSRPAQLCRLVIHGIPPAKAGGAKVRLLIGVSPMGGVEMKAILAESRAELPVEIAGPRPSVPVARNRP